MIEKLTLSLAGALVCAGFVANAQVIDFSAGAADLTFFYDSGSDSWDVVFRATGNTDATGLTNQADQTRFGASPNDYQFNTLNVIAGEPERVTVNGISYWTPDEEEVETNPDLGVRTRLREGEDVDQFQNFTITLDWDNSTKPAGAEFAMFDFDLFGDPEFAYETATGNLTEDWDIYGHSHWHWGFSEIGDYTLVFNFQGQREDLSLSSIGTTSVNFQVVPEPATVAGLLGLAALGLVLLRRRRGLAGKSGA